MARNDITGDSIANTKGSAEKYAQGWERIFGGKVEEPTTVMALDFHDSQPVPEDRTEMARDWLKVTHQEWLKAVLRSTNEPQIMAGRLCA